MQIPASFDWSKLVGPGLVIAVLGWFGWMLRPLLARLLYNIAEVEPGRAADFVFKALSADGAEERFRKYSERAHADRIREVNERVQIGEEAMEAAQANKDRLEALNESMKAHGAELSKIKDKVDGIPRLSDTLDRLSTTMEKVGEHMERANQFMTRVDERERIRGEVLEDRRSHQTANSPRRRRTDPHDQEGPSRG